MNTAPLIDGQTLKLSHLDKVYYPATGFRKGDVLDYYRQIATVLVPHLEDRPLTLKRFPNGVDQAFFYEKAAPSYRPTWLKTFPVEGETGTVRYCLVDSTAGLLWIVNLGAIELHPFLARVPRVDRPTHLAFDLDPGAPATLLDCLGVALKLRDLLAALGLKSFPKTSGGKGLHLYVPLNTPTSYDATRPFAHAVALWLERKNPNLVVSKMRKDLRSARILLDWSQNAEHKTTVSVYSLRPTATPSVSTPLHWEEVERAWKKKKTEGLRFSPAEILKRIKREGDLFKPLLTLRQKLPDLQAAARLR